MATVVVQSSCDCPYWVAIDDIDVPLNNGHGAVHNVAPGDHALIWAVMGNPGDSFSAVLTINDEVVGGVDGWTIPDNDGGWTGGYAPFSF